MAVPILFVTLLKCGDKQTHISLKVNKVNKLTAIVRELVDHILDRNALIDRLSITDC